jgi:hypothetical protein
MMIVVPLLSYPSFLSLVPSSKTFETTIVGIGCGLIKCAMSYKCIVALVLLVMVADVLLLALLAPLSLPFLFFAVVFPPPLAVLEAVDFFLADPGVDLLPTAPPFEPLAVAPTPLLLLVGITEMRLASKDRRNMPKLSSDD